MPPGSVPNLDQLAASARRAGSRPSDPRQDSQPGALPSYPDPTQATPLPSYPDPSQPTPLPSYPDPSQPGVPAPAPEAHASHPSHPSHASHPSHPGPQPMQPEAPPQPEASPHFPAPSGAPLGAPLGAPPAEPPAAQTPVASAPAAPVGFTPQAPAAAPASSDYRPSPVLQPPDRPDAKSDSKLTYAVVFLGAVSIVVSAGLLVRYFTRPSATPVASPPASATTPVAESTAKAAGTAAPAPEPTASATASSRVAVAPPDPPKTDDEGAEDGKPSTASDGPEAEARAALEKLRDGVKKCAETHIGVLPGTSKPVPASFRMFQKGRYHSPGFVWKTPVFHCTAFSLSKPQPFMIQWQSEGPKTTGQGVAWIDDDGDWKPDRSLSFPARFVKRNEIEVGDVVVDETIRVTKKP